MKKIIIYILILKATFSFSQVYKNDLEEFNLKGKVKYIFCNKFDYKNHPFFQSKISFIEYNYYFQFDINGNLEAFGEFEKDSITKEKIFLSKQLVDNKEKNVIKYDSLNRIIDIESYFSNGYFKNKIASKTTYEYQTINDSFYRITNFEASVDTTDIGREYLNFNPREFNAKEHTKYTFYKNILLSFNSKKQLINKYFYCTPFDFIEDEYKDSYISYVDFKYNSNGDVSESKEFHIKMLSHPSIESYEYEYDKMNNWIKKIVICTNCVEEKDRVKNIFKREIIYW